MNMYQIYGIIIESEIELYNLPKIIGTPDVSIIYGEISYENIPEKSKDFYYSPDYVCFSTPTCSYSIRNGKTIVVNPKESADPNDTIAFLIGWCFAFLFTQRGFSCLHSTAIDIDGQGVIISGVSGSGKSTTALSLINHGNRYLTDDMTVINPLNSMDIIPAYPLQKVCRNVAETLDPEKLFYINEHRDKFAYVDKDRFCDSPRPWTTLILLKAGDVEVPTVKEMTGLDKLLKTLECLYLAEIYSFKGTPDLDKFRLLKGCEKIHVYEITRPKCKDTVDQITNLITELVHNQN